MFDTSHYTLKSRDVYTVTVQLLNELPLATRRLKVQVTDLLNVVVFAAAFRLSINQACNTLEGVPTGATVLGHLADQLHDINRLEKTLNQLLAKPLPKGLGAKGRRVCVDLVRLPYHGTLKPEHDGELCRSQAKRGTTHFFTYATAYVIWKGRRSTLAVCRVRQHEKMDQVLKILMQRLRILGVRISILLLDREFYSVRVIRYVIRRHQPFIMAAIKRGKTADQGGGPTGTRMMAQFKSSRWGRYTLKNPQEGRVSFDLAVICRNFNGRWGRHQRETWLYATWGVRDRAFSWIRETYRTRFGIESSYRQLNQAKIKTCSRNPVLRLLFVGVALILRNVWVWLHAEVIAVPRQGARLFNPASLRFERLLLWLLFEVAHHYHLLHEIFIPRDFQEVAYEFGLVFKY